MPLLDNMTSQSIDGTGYQFSGTRIDQLGASEYTLVALIADVSSSVLGFRAGIEKAVKETILACRRSPRSDNLLVRLVLFNSAVSENHGFRPLSECDVDKYTGVINPGGCTALFDAVYNGVESVSRYGADLMKNDFDVNAIVVCITDGEDNVSKMTPDTVKQSIGRALHDETLESLKTILIGLNTDHQLNSYLQRVKDECGFDQYVDAGDANEKTLAKVAAFISKSISSTSQALGTGGPSQSLTF